MPVEFIGYVGNANGSETIRATGKALDLNYIEALAKVQESGGFDRVLLAFSSTSPESILVGQHVTSVTRNLNVMIAHRPGFTAPTIAARQLATLDHISGGRVGVHIITGGNDVELAQDGDHLTKDERYARTSEYLDIVRQEWTSAEPFDYDGRYYKVDKGFGGIKPVQQNGIPVYFGGASDAALQVAGKHADIYALWGETHAQVKELLQRVREAAAPYGRSPRFSLSLRPILAETEEAAWAKANNILEKAKALIDAGRVRDANNQRFNQIGGRNPANEGSKRLLAAAEQGTVLDKRLWTGIAGLTGAQGNTTSLVGTPDQVAEAFLDYYDLGITTFLIRGFDPIEDAFHYGRDLLPRVRELVAQRDRAAKQAHAAE
ncbi:LLM class flavin-dependent oxidoreductase [Phyllobacterium sp. 0TCS1.6C]|uniref:LLM class flavin-dependent oxidoreductase n=1 Tax=unclassified Phyllobacterium TaxID=2638441 RepID=UPI0022654B83|nr:MULTISPECIES: LLM class flavin-dependent oxidoreductase [unclassified Phyllobacterium]MCX8280625.1 LLM class flavin-dependent oxidoreductase [Phyllobacterium sp. 0TCS1.6C]MCX8292798.1 LLM class flavin-dependent oxidoreductase [Phyllobacterium sp. 0TCS1.6A]